MSPVDQDSRRLDSWSLVEGSYYAKTEWQAPVHGMFKLYNPATRTLRSMAISAEGFASLPPRVRLFFNISILAQVSAAERSKTPFASFGSGRNKVTLNTTSPWIC